MIKLAEALDHKGINYIWYVFTNDKEEIPSDNVIYMKPRLDIGRWIQKANYLVQLSDTEACSYSINEALYRNVPVIVTPLPYLEEIGVKDNKNAYIMKFDCSNIEDIVNKIKYVPEFEFKKLKDGYDKILHKGINPYQRNQDIMVQIIQGYKDLKLQRYVEPNEILIEKSERAMELVKARVGRIV